MEIKDKDTAAYSGEPGMIAYRTRLASTLPDPNITGPCEVQASPFCEPAAGQQRMNPMDQLNPDRSFRAYAPICQPCYDHLADAYVTEVHTNPAHAHLFDVNRTVEMTPREVARASLPRGGNMANLASYFSATPESRT